VLLRSEDEDPRMKSRIDETSKVLRDSVDDIVVVKGVGSGVVQLLTTIQICDSASLYLACLRGIFVYFGDAILNSCFQKEDPIVFVTVDEILDIGILRALKGISTVS
jgi:hypothetical protein